MVLEVFADVLCPFTHVGLRRLISERARRGRDDVVVRVRAWPLELVNGEPLSAALVTDSTDARQLHPPRTAAAYLARAGWSNATSP
jgi:predicted DsbA family dithiol-disulfide isomerase